MRDPEASPRFGAKCLQNGHKSALCPATTAAQLANRVIPQGGVYGGDQTIGHEVELLRPDGRLAADREDAVALGGGAGGGGDRGPRDALPGLLDPRERRGRREPARERSERDRQRTRGGPAHAAIASWRIAPGEIRRRATDGPLAPGTCARSVAAMTLWPPAARSSASSRRRSASSSLMTSSSNISGVRPRSLASTSRSASSSASSASRCSPCEP